MREDARKRFLGYDQTGMIEKFHLTYDEDYLYIRFIGRPYRVNRRTGKTEWSEDNFSTVFPALFNDSMAIFDVLCDSKPNCRLRGTFNQIDRLKGAHIVSAPGMGISKAEADYFDQHLALLSKALENFGGVKTHPGDVAYVVPTFEFLPVVFQYWASDDEFPSTLKFMWDDNTLDFLHFETAYYVMGHFLGRVKEEMEREGMADFPCIENNTKK